MTDPGYRKMVEQDFQKKKKVLEGNPGNLFAVFDSPMSVEEREALRRETSAPLALRFSDERGRARGADVSLRLFSVD